MLSQKTLLLAFLKRPFYYFWNYFAFFSNQGSSLPFFHGLTNETELTKLVEDPKNPLLLGFSYCQKPLLCPSGRFTENCQFDCQVAVCQDCFIGKCWQTQAQNTEKTIITTVSFLAKKLLSLASEAKIKKNQPLFLISACAFSIKEFQGFYTPLKLKGRSFPLTGGICGSWKAFIKAEKGQKKGAVLLSGTAQKKILKLLEMRSISLPHG